MTESNLPAVRQPETREIAKADTDSWIEVVGEVAKFAGYIAATEFVPKSLRDSPAAATAAIMYGRELGLPPMTALTQTHVIEGKPAMSAEAMRAQVIAAGHDIQVLESTGAVCRMRARRRGSDEWTPEVVWSIDMARAAGLLSKNNWKNFPRRMLQARCSSELCELHFPDVVLGFKSVEEMEDLGAEEGNALMPAEQATTRVQRSGKGRATKRAAAKPAELPAAPAPAQRPAAPAGPPLPGEDGYEEPTTTGSPGGAPGAEPAAAGRSAGQQTKGATELPTRGDGEAASAGESEGEGEAPEDTPADTATETAGPGEAAADEPAAEDPGPAEGEPPPSPRKASRAQHRMIFASLQERGVDPKDDEERLLIASKVVGRPIESFNDLMSGEAKQIIDTLARTKNRDQLWALLDEIDAQADDES